MEVDIRAALDTIDHRPFHDGGRYLRIDNDDDNCVWVDDRSSHPRLRLGTLRRGDWPQIENAGELRELTAEAGESVVESVHVSFFDRHIVGSEFNFYGPRLRSRLPAYLSAQAGLPSLSSP